jgi:hypothetical protein
MTRINRRKLISAGAVLAVVSLSVATVPAQALSTKQTFSSKYETGVNRSEIKLGMTLPMTGAASP